MIKQAGWNRYRGRGSASSPKREARAGDIAGGAWQGKARTHSVLASRLRILRRREPPCPTVSNMKHAFTRASVRPRFPLPPSSTFSPARFPTGHAKGGSMTLLPSLRAHGWARKGRRRIVTAILQRHGRRRYPTLRAHGWARRVRRRIVTAILQRHGCRARVHSRILLRIVLEHMIEDSGALRLVEIR